MKTQIIQLEPHDDIISTRDKLSTAQANRIILVWPPKRGGMLNLRLDLTLLNRYSNQLGVQLGLVTTHDQVRYFADEIGIPVFRNLRSAQTNRWRTNRRRNFNKDLAPEAKDRLPIQKPEFMDRLDWLQKPIIRLIIFSISMASVAAVIAVVIPKAEIYVLPNQNELALNLSVSANSDQKEPSLAGEFPLRSGTIIVEGRQSILASGSIKIPEKPAVGKVEFTNLTEENIVVPAGTIVTTLGSPAIRFMTIDPVNIPKGVGTKRSTTIIAQIPGSLGNTASNTIQAIEGVLGLQLSVTNPSATSQGSDRTAAAPSEMDRNSIHTSLLSSLKMSAAKELEDQLTQDDSIVDLPLIETLEMLRVIEETYTPEEGQPADQISLLLRLEFLYNYVSAKDLQSFAGTILNANTPSGFVPVPGTQKIHHLPQSNHDKNGILTWDMELRQLIQEEIAPEEISMVVRGKSIQNAKSLIQTQLNLVETPMILISPTWWPFIPVLPYQISVSFQSTEK